MSADAKAWYDDSGNLWRAVHDGECSSAIPHDHGDRLVALLARVEQCMGESLRWECRAYPDGRMGLVGYVV